MFLRQRLTSALNHRRHYSAGLVMSAISAGGLESETPAANLPHGSPSMYVLEWKCSLTFTDVTQALNLHL